MLVQNSVYRNTYLTDGVNKDFYFSFPILESSQVLVQTSLLTNTDVVTTIDPSQYTVTGVGLTTGGHISFATAPSSGSRIALTLNIPITQLYQYAELDSFPAKSHEDALAKLTLICQQLKEQLERAVMLPSTSSDSPEVVIAGIYASRDAAVASASTASNKADAAEVSAIAAANSANTAEQTVQTAAADAVASATAQANAAAASALAAAASAANAEEASGGLAPRMDAVELKNTQQDARIDDVIVFASTPKYEIGEFYYFRHPTLKPGFAPLQGGLISGAYQGKNITEYPIWAYLQTTEGQKLCKTEAEWQAMTTATWGDGSFKASWNGIGGAPFYVQNLGAGTLRLPDLRGMYAEAAGFDSLGAGGVHGDAIRDIVGDFGQGQLMSGYSAGIATGPFRNGSGSGAQAGSTGGSSNGLGFTASRAVPTASKNQPRGWGALACCYLGQVI